MDTPDRKTVTVVARDVIQAGCEDAAWQALDQLAKDVHRHEPEMLTFLVHAADERKVAIIATCRDIAAYFRLARGAVFAKFAAEHRQLFASPAGAPFANAEQLSMRAGFSRDPGGLHDATPAAAANRHPAVMFEVIGKDQDSLKRFYQQVFGWQYQIGTGAFAYVHFDGNDPPLLGGIGQALPNVPGFEPGHSFYLLVDDLAAVIARAEHAGGKQHMPPTDVDGYHFAMIQDPEGNPIGLITPFDN